MLHFIRLKNLAIVSELELEFGSGMNIITGETGSGKSLILKGLELLRGAKASADLIRAGCERAEIEAQFLLDERARERTLSDLREEFEWADEVLAEGEIVLRRVIDQNGRGKIYINGRLSSRVELETFAEALFDITGQHSQQRLLDRRFHLLCLDQFGVKKELLEAVADSFARYSEVFRRYEKARVESSAQAEHLRRLAFERDELKEFGLKAGEREELEAELKRASSVEALSAGVQELLQLLEGEEGAGLEPLSGKFDQVLSKLVRFDDGLRELLELSSAVVAQLSEVRLAVEHYAARLEVDPERLEALRSRLSDLARLERKYGKSVDDLIPYFVRISEELALYESGAYDLGKLEKELAALKQELNERESLLTAERRRVSEKLSRAVEKGLSDLDMKKARFSIQLEPARSSELGADSVQFFLAANPGEPAAPLAEVASGGELSRVLLVLKNLLNEQTTPVLQVFDEIDVGVGGATAQVLGEKLKALTPRFQLIVVTHAPQIAALGDRHLVIEKRSTKTTTEVFASALSKDERVAEVARMLAGKDVTEEFISSARRLFSGQNS
jgi:DNA repair protein RecN (Recombination protein N)